MNFTDGIGCTTPRKADVINAAIFTKCHQDTGLFELPALEFKNFWKNYRVQIPMHSLQSDFFVLGHDRNAKIIEQNFIKI